MGNASIHRKFGSFIRKASRQSKVKITRILGFIEPDFSSKNCTAEAFEIVLEGWYREYKSYLNECTTNSETGKSYYTHQRLRSAYLSLKRNLPLLFTFERYPERYIPKTTNLLESRFGDMKHKIGGNQGMKMENKILFIKDYFSTEAG